MKSGDDPLVGRHFNAAHMTATPERIDDNTITSQGVVLASPQPGYYLVQLLGVDRDAHNIQRLVKIEEMLSWQFFESKNEMTNDLKRTQP
jgi:hypothetical protein